MCVYERESVCKRESVCVSGRKRVCVREREYVRECECVCVCVLVRERERERESEKYRSNSRMAVLRREVEGNAPLSVHPLHPHPRFPPDFACTPEFCLSFRHHVDGQSLRVDSQKVDGVAHVPVPACGPGVCGT